MKKGLLLATILVVLSLSLAGCLGGEDVETPTVPEAHFTYSAVPDKTDTFRFDATGSSGGSQYLWNFGDTGTGEGRIVDHTFDFGAGVYNVQLVVVNDKDIRDIDSQDIIVGDGQNAPPVADFTPSTRYIGVDQPFSVDATGTTDPEGDRIRYDWTFNLFMKEREYKIFRERKAKAVAEEYGSDVSSQQSRGDPVADALKALDGLVSDREDGGHDHGGGNEGLGDVGWDGRRSTWDVPVFELSEGFPSAGIYYVKLRTYDIKGASQDYVSEQVWPVEVVERPRSEILTNEDDPIKANITAMAATSDVSAATPDDTGFYTDHNIHHFDVERKAKRLVVNITWKDPETIGRDLYMILKSPLGHDYKTSGDIKTSGTTLYRKVEIIGIEAEGPGTWQIDVTATKGVLIDYEIVYTGILDLTPEQFLEIEEPFQG